MKKIWLISLGVILAVTMITSSLILAGCGDGAGRTASQAAGQTMTITDGVGREVIVQKNPERIVSLAPANTEILFALGLGDKVFGVTEICNYPGEAQGKEKVGGYQGIDLEKVISIDPDLILAEDLHKTDVVPALEDLGFTVLVMRPHDLKETEEAIELIGKITGTGDRAAEIVNDMELRAKAITDLTGTLDVSQLPRVLYAMYHEPIYTIGTNTFIHEMIMKAGGTNIAAFAGEGWPTLSLEQVISLNPQVVIVDNEASLLALNSDFRLAGLDAFKNGRVYLINPDLTSRQGPRIIEGLERMSRMIHPELFGPVN